MNIHDPKAKHVPVRASSIEIDKDEKRVSTGIVGLDQCLAESDESPPGLPMGCSVLLSGMPGGGKSTIATYMAAATAGGESLYLHGEERAASVKKRWDRLNLGAAADPWLFPLKATERALEVIRDLNSENEMSVTMDPATGKLIYKKLMVVVVDSIQTLTLGGKRKYDDQYEGTEMIVGQVTSHGGTCVLVSHVSKSGDTHAGAAGLAHLVDVHVHVSVNAKKGERFLEVRKNRFGRAGFQVPLSIGISSLTVGTPAPISQGNGGQSQARTMLEKACEKAKELLISGKELNGYDGDEAGLTNGNMWRAALSLAVKQLQRDQYVVDEFKVKGRNTWKIVHWPENKDKPNPSESEPAVLPIELD